MNHVRFGPYEIVRELGAGGSSYTNLAIWHQPLNAVGHKLVCLKRFHPTTEDFESLARAWSDEVTVASTLRHSQIVSLLDWGILEGHLYWAYDFVDGIDLRKLNTFFGRARVTLDNPVLALIADQVAHALHYAHRPESSRRALVHRDLSPENILISRFGEVKVADFSNARVLATYVGAGSGTGTTKFDYLSPECHEDALLRDARSDLYALGVILYEIVAGRPPYRGANPVASLLRARSGQCDRLENVQPSVCARLAEVIHALIRPNPDERFASASDLIDALHSWLPYKHAPAKTLEEIVAHIAPPQWDDVSGLRARMVVGSAAPSPGWLRTQEHLPAAPDLSATQVSAPASFDPRAAHADLPVVDLAALRKG